MKKGEFEEEIRELGELSGFRAQKKTLDRVVLLKMVYINLFVALIFCLFPCI